MAVPSIASILAYPTIVEPRWLELTRTDISLPKWQSARSVRVLHLADFHSSLAVPDSLIEQAIDIGLGQQPDLACLTGDFITFRTGFTVSSYQRSLAKLAQTVPTYAVLGNHDGGRWAPHHGGFADHQVVEQMLIGSGVKLLHNRAERRRFRDQELMIVGVGDLWSEEIDADSAFQDLIR